MEKEGGVCSRELAQRLKKSGEKQESLWWWQYLDSEYDGVLDMQERFELVPKESVHPMLEHYSAPTVAELGERLPARIIDNEGSEWFLEIWKVNPGKWEVKYRNGDCNFIIEYADNLANAMTEMLIYLRKNKWIEEG